MSKYKHIFTDKSGTTDLVQHEVTLTSNATVRIKPYCLGEGKYYMYLGFLMR